MSLKKQVSRIHRYLLPVFAEKTQTKNLSSQRMQNLRDVLIAVIDAESNSSVVPWQLLFYVDLPKKAFVLIK